MKSEKKQKVGLGDKSEQINKMKKSWIARDSFKEFEKDFSGKLGRFEREYFPDEKSCRRQLRHWLGWKQGKKNAVFNCPKCGCKKATVSKKKEGGRVRLVFRCRNSKCRATPSPLSVTFMANSRVPLRFWFLCVFSIVLTNGKVPWAYLNKRRIDFDSGENCKTIQIREMANILYLILRECADIKKRMECCRLVRERYAGGVTFNGYGSWYKSNCWAGWRIAFRRKSLKKEFLHDAITSKKYQEGVRYIYMQSKLTIQKDEWLLVAHINGENNLKTLQWMYVSGVKRIDKKESTAYKKGYRFVGIDVEEDDEECLFKVGLRFKKSFQNCYGDKLEGVKSGLVVSPSTKLLGAIYDKYQK